MPAMCTAHQKGQVQESRDREATAHCTQGRKPTVNWGNTSVLHYISDERCLNASVTAGKTIGTRRRQRLSPAATLIYTQNQRLLLMLASFALTLAPTEPFALRTLLPAARSFSGRCRPALQAARRTPPGRQGDEEPGGRGDDQLKDKLSDRGMGISRWNGPLDDGWQEQLEASRERSSGRQGSAEKRRLRPLVRDPWQDKQVKRVLFPRTAGEAIDQAADAVEEALNQGVFRLRVEMKLAEFDLQQQSLSQSQMPQLLDGIVSRLLARGLRVLLLFNSVRDASEASKLLSSRGLQGRVGMSVLGLGDFAEQFDVAVLVSASNEGTNNLQRIESVERLLYAGPPPGVTKKVDKNKFMQRPIILINAHLEAIHSMASASRKLMWEKTSFPSDVDLAQMTDLTAADWLHSAANKI